MKTLQSRLLSFAAAGSIAALLTAGAAALGRDTGGSAGHASNTEAQSEAPTRPAARQDGAATSFEAASARFKPLNPAAPNGAQISTLWGDPRTGPSAALLRFPRNYGGRLHTHSADYHLSLLQGTMKHWVEDQREADAAALGAGAYWHQPAGQVHSDNCLSEYCLAFMKFEGPSDVKYVEPPR